MAAHRLDQLEVLLQLADDGLARPLMDRVAALRGDGLAPLLDRLFDAASPPGRLHRIDRLDLDLGTLPWDGLEAALLQRLEPALRRALAQALHDAPAGRAEAEAARDWLLSRARTGLLPWWAAASGDAEAPHHIAALRADGGWLALLAALADDPVALRRLARAGGAAAVAVDDAAATAALQAAAGELAQRLLAGSGSDASRAPMSPGDALAGGAPGLVAWRAGLLAALAAGARRGQVGLQPVLDQALRSLPPGDRARLAQGAGVPARGREVAVALDRLATAGLTGQGPSPSGVEAAAGTAAAGRDAEAVSTSEAGPEAAADAQAGGAEAAQAAETAAGGPAGRAHRSAHRVPPPAPGMPVMTDAPGPPDSARRAVRQAHAAPSVPEQIDVPDAGLVLLWPFIVPLFQHAGLVTPERSFVDAAARTRGVLLLAQLSWPEPAPAEPRLALAKLLCGLSPGAPFEPDAPPTEAEAAACADLLAAALSHAATTAPAFARIDVPAFQALFVQRAGLLGARNGAWLLQVAQRGEDALLDRLPWTWAWVRLPWMDHPLQVQW